MVARTHILRVRAEAKQFRTGQLLQDPSDHDMQSSFIAQITGAEIAVDSDSRERCGFFRPTVHVIIPCGY
jgi:hypothetical protein